MTRLSELLIALLLAASTLLIAAHFAPIGSNAGFVDMGHDGYTLREALDLERGATLFKDTYEQYGPLGPYLNFAAFELFGRRLLAIKYGICLWYAAIALLVYATARHVLDPFLSVVAAVMWLSLAPFYQHGVMVSVHVYVLFAQAAAVLALLHYIDNRRLSVLAVAGAFCGIACILKQSVGLLFGAAIGAYLLCRLARRQSAPGRLVIELATFGAPVLAVIGTTFWLLWRKGALHDWYLQSILFPQQFYLGEGDGTGVASDSMFSFPLRFYYAHVREGVAFYWYLIRIVLGAGLLVSLFRSRVDRTNEKLVLVGLVSLMLWAAAYPSPHYMHQWWTLSLGFAAFIYYLRDAASAFLSRRGRDPALARALAVTMTFLIVLPGVKARILDGGLRTFEQQETILAPWVISGIRTTFEARNDFATLFGTIRQYREQHPATPLISVDSSDGWRHGIAESLLWLSLVDDNPHRHPVYWSMPVLASRTYPEYAAVLRSEIHDWRPLVGEARIGPYKPQIVRGYHVLLGLRTTRGMWYLYAPNGPEPSSDAATLIRVLPPRRTGRRPRDNFMAQEAVVVARRENRDVYAWPYDVDVPDELPEPQEMIGNAGTAVDPRLRTTASAWSMDGIVAEPYSYLFQGPVESRNAGDYFVVRGTLEQGGLTLGLQWNGLWRGYVNVTTAGPFAVLLRAPGAGRWQVVLANCLTNEPLTEKLLHPVRWWTGELKRNHFQVTSAGWASEASP
jgi:hypothetical protein